MDLKDRFTRIIDGREVAFYARTTPNVSCSSHVPREPAPPAAIWECTIEGERVELFPWSYSDLDDPRFGDRVEAHLRGKTGAR